MFFRRHQKGFSVVELLVVIGIFVIGLAIAVPSLMQMGKRSQVKSGARKIKDALYTARMRAVELNDTVTVQFDTDAETYTTTSSDGEVLDSYSFNNVDLGINIDPATITWNTQGLTGNSCTITVTHGADQYNVVVASTGNVRIAIP